MQQAMDAQRFNWEMTMTATLRMLLVLALLFGFGQTRAQTPSDPVSGVDAALIEDIVIGSRILAEFGVLDGFGHVSARHPTNPGHFLMSRSLAPALVTATTSWNSISTETPWATAADRSFWNASFTAKSTRRGRT